MDRLSRRSMRSIPAMKFNLSRRMSALWSIDPSTSIFCRTSCPHSPAVPIATPQLCTSFTRRLYLDLLPEQLPGARNQLLRCRQRRLLPWPWKALPRHLHCHRSCLCQLSRRLIPMLTKRHRNSLTKLRRPVAACGTRPHDRRLDHRKSASISNVQQRD